MACSCLYDAKKPKNREDLIVQRIVVKEGFSRDMADMLLRDLQWAIALNRIYTQILRQQVSEITDFFLPMEALSYKAAVISIDKAYPGQAKPAAMAFWTVLPQFTHTKFVIIVDKEINIRDPRQVVWAITSKVDPVRDVFILPETPFDSLDFASEKIGLGGRMAIDATTKIYPETDHEWGEVLESDTAMAEKVTQKWAEYGLGELNLGDLTYSHH